MPARSHGAGTSPPRWKPDGTNVEHRVLDAFAGAAHENARVAEPDAARCFHPLEDVIDSGEPHDAVRRPENAHVRALRRNPRFQHDALALQLARFGRHRGEQAKQGRHQSHHKDPNVARAGFEQRQQVAELEPVVSGARRTPSRGDACALLPALMLKIEL